MLGNTDVCWCEFAIFLTILKESVLQMQLFFQICKLLNTNVFILIYLGISNVQHVFSVLCHYSAIY